MKKLIIGLLCLFGLKGWSQTNDKQSFYKDVIQSQLMEYHGETKICISVDSSWINYQLNRLQVDSQKPTLVFKSRNTQDSIQISSKERDSILAFFSQIDNLSLTENPTEFETIASEVVLEHLKKDFQNQVVFISSTLFLRDGAIGIVYFANLCCGSFNGNVNFSFYKKENGHWIRWIDIGSGAF